MRLKIPPATEKATAATIDRYNETLIDTPETRLMPKAIENASTPKAEDTFIKAEGIIFEFKVNSSQANT